MKIGNIIYLDDLVNHKEVKYVNYYQNPENLEEIDFNLPTLFVGWKNMKSIIEKYDLKLVTNILEHRIVTNKLYWEFSFDENKSSHIEGVSDFITQVPKYYFHEYQYINLDPVLFQIRDINDLFDVLPKKFNCEYVYRDQMIYLLSDNKIYGLNIRMYDFFKFPIREIQNRIVDRCEGAAPIILDPDGDIFSQKNLEYMNMNKLRRYLVVILSK